MSDFVNLENKKSPDNLNLIKLSGDEFDSKPGEIGLLKII